MLDKKRRWRVQRAESAESERKRGRGRAKGKWAGRGKSAGKAERSQSVDERARRMSCAPWSLNVVVEGWHGERAKAEKKDKGKKGRKTASDAHRGAGPAVVAIARKLPMSS